MFQERTPILAICNATRQLGILIGPVFQLILTYFSFKIGTFEVTPLNAPGIFMAGLWVVFAILTYFCFFNLSVELKTHKRQERLRNNAPPLVIQPGQDCPPILEASAPSGHQITAQRALGSDWGPDQSSIHASHASGNTLGNQSGIESSTAQSQVRRQRTLSYSERFMNSLAQSGQKSTTGIVSLLDASGMTLTRGEGGSYLSGKSGHNISNLKIRLSFFKNFVVIFYLLAEFLTDYFVLMLSMVFTLFFCQVGVETIVPVVMQDYFGYTEFENSLVYMAGGAEALIVFFSVALISRYVRDTNLMVLGWVSFTVAHIWLLVFLPQFQQWGTGSAFEVAMFMIGLYMVYFGYAGKPGIQEFY